MIRITDDSIGRCYTLSNGAVIRVLHKSEYKTAYHDFYLAEILIQSSYSRMKKGSYVMIRETGKLKGYSIHVEKVYYIPLKDKIDLL